MFLLIKSIPIVLISLLFSNNSIASLSEEEIQKRDEFMVLGITNLVCAYYGEFTRELDRPIRIDSFFDESKRLLSKAFSNKEVAKSSKVTDIELYNNLKAEIVKNYKQKGPEYLKGQLSTAFTTYNLPNWVKNCDDLGKYSSLM